MSVPKLRFKTDDGSEFPEWEEKRLGDITKPVHRKSEKNSTIPVMMISQGNGFIYQSEKYSRENAGQSLKNYTLLQKGEMAYNHGASKAKPYGVTYVLKEECEARVPYVYHCFSLNEEEEGNYWNYALNTAYMDRQLKKMVSSGVRMDGLLNITYDSYMNVKIMHPIYREQHKIATFLQALDNIINQTQSEIDAWEKQKRGVMQLLFSRKVRFKADDGSEFPEWISIKLNGILNEYREMSEKGGIYEHASLTKEGVILKTERYDRDFLVKDENKAYRVTHINDICYNPANLKFGVICRNKLGDVIFSPIYVTFKVNLSYDPVFVEYLVTRPDFINYALRYEEGTVYERMAVKQEDLLSISVNVPCTEEQKKIAACLSTFDTIIGRAKQELAAYRELKKGLLQQMFV